MIYMCQCSKTRSDKKVVRCVFRRQGLREKYIALKSPRRDEGAKINYDGYIYVYSVDVASLFSPWREVTNYIIQVFADGTVITIITVEPRRCHCSSTNRVFARRCLILVWKVTEEIRRLHPPKQRISRNRRAIKCDNR